jgi:hypothetical protein
LSSNRFEISLKVGVPGLLLSSNKIEISLKVGFSGQIYTRPLCSRSYRRRRMSGIIRFTYDIGANRNVSDVAVTSKVTLYFKDILLLIRMVAVMVLDDRTHETVGVHKAPYVDQYPWYS